MVLAMTVSSRNEIHCFNRNLRYCYCLKKSRQFQRISYELNVFLKDLFYWMI